MGLDDIKVEVVDGAGGNDDLKIGAKALKFWHGGSETNRDQILIVDDDETIRMLMRRVVSRLFEDFEVVDLESSTEAMRPLSSGAAGRTAKILRII